MKQPADEGRRRLLRQLAKGTFVATCAPGLLSGSRALAGSSGKKMTASQSKSSVNAERVRGIADLLRPAPRDKVFALAAEQIRAGANHRELLGGILLAAVHDVEPRPPGTKHHAVLMVPSVLQLAEAAGDGDPWPTIFYNLAELKRSQAQDVAQGDWVLPPAPKPLTDDPARARAALQRALEEWDHETADRAATAAVRLLGTDEIFELLWSMGGRDFLNVGHKMIHTSQTRRSLTMLQDQLREPLIRSLVYGLLDGGPGEMTSAFERSRTRVAAMPADWAAGRPDPDATTELMTRLRTASSNEAVDRVLELLGEGVAPESIWDGLRLAASEILYRQRVTRPQGEAGRRPLLLSVHPLTTLNSFHFAYRQTASDETRRLMLLQTAAWLPLFRSALIRIVGLPMDGPGYGGLRVASESVTAVEAARVADGDYDRSAALTMKLAASPEQARAFIAECRRLVAHKGSSAHHHKYAAAAFEEFGHADSRWAPFLLATCLSYLPRPGDGDTSIYRETRAALAST